jgi:hypothetical protein
MEFDGLGAVAGDEHDVAFLAQEGFEYQLVDPLVVGDQDPDPEMAARRRHRVLFPRKRPVAQEMTNSFSKWAMSSAWRTMPRGFASTRPSLALLARSRSISSMPSAELST